MNDFLLILEAIGQVIKNFFIVIPGAIVLGILVNKLSEEAEND